MSLDVSIEDFDMSQFEPLAALFGSYFEPDDKLLTRVYTEWLYGGNPLGLARMVKVTEGRRWVGFMAMIPVELIRRGQQLRGYYLVNGLVHPQFHGQFLFGRLGIAAKELVKAENAVMIGHPNDMAIKSWQRAKMHFFDPLKPSLAVPRLRPRGVRVIDIKSHEQLQPVWPALNVQALQAERWQIAATGEYIAWRYLTHPSNLYRIQMVDVGDEPAGFMVTRKVRPGISLLVDQFLIDRHASAALACLPWLTVSFRPLAAARALPGALWPLPIKKQIPFFFTHYQEPANARDVMCLGLSASDF